jgi:hypothetical protein
MLTREQRDIKNAKARMARRMFAEHEGRKFGRGRPLKPAEELSPAYAKRLKRPQGESPTPRSPLPGVLH